ncbi:MAG: TetR/AcrR family transcriptional regulator [Nitrospinae bacterium]|nr:TetR/AcrR family transcriptional regulator [Nitrospinota bacterium]
METATETPKGLKASATKQKIIEAAARLVYHRGFHATSLDMVAQAALVNRGSLYYFFRSKKNLGLAVIDHYESLLHENYLAPSFDIEASGREKIRRLAESYARMPIQDSPCCGCPIGNLSLELSALDEGMRVRLKEVWDGVFERIALVLAQSQEDGDLPGNIAPLVYARSFFSQIQGAHIIARCSQDEASLYEDCERAFMSLPWAQKEETR